MRARIKSSAAASWASGALAVVVMLGVTGCGGGSPQAHSASGTVQNIPSPHIRQPPPRAHDRRPNIVFVLTDDLSRDLVPYMNKLSALKRHGLTFRNYFVSDSLCCPSRASIFTGDFPHNTGVFTNTGADGGIRAFWKHNDQRSVFNLALYKAGYRTAMMGKYLNGYLSHRHSPVPATYVPAGWSEWDVAGWGYPEYHYTLNQNGTLHHYGSAPRDYMTSVLTRLGVSFVNQAQSSRRPFFLELATFSPHAPYVPAPRDAHRFPGLKAPHPPNWNRLPTNPPSWLQGHPPLSAVKRLRINRAFRRRVQDVQSIDRLIAAIERAVARQHLSRNTYFVFSTDNGYHTGEYRLVPGKLTAFDTDIRVPLIVAGPGVRPGSSTAAMAENIDLASTFTSLAGIPFSSDGQSLTPLFKGGLAPPDWRDAILVEHHGPDYAERDPDRQNFDSGNPPSYEAMRTKDFLYVEYANGQREFYDLRTDPYELDNVVGNLSTQMLARLHIALQRLQDCHGGLACRKAEHLPAQFISQVAADSKT